MALPFKMKKDGLSGDALKFADVMEASLATAFEETTKGMLTAEEVDKLINKALEGKGLTAEQEKTISETAEAVRIQAAELKKINDAGIETKVENFEKTLEDNKERLKKVFKEGSGMTQFIIKAAAVTTTATTGATRTMTNSVDAFGAQRLGDGPMNLIQRPTPFILDYVNVGSTNSSTLIWFDELAKEGDFAITAEGVLKPLVQYRFERKNAIYQKAAGYTVLTDEFDRDFPQLVTTIRRLMQIDIRNKIADLILVDLLAAASAFTYTGLNAGIDNADNYAAVAAAIAQKQALYFGGPNVLFLNQADAVKMRFTKASSGEYIVPPLEWGVDAIIIDPRITAGTFIVGDLNMFNVDFYGDVIVKIGYVNDDLIKNQYTVVVERYFYDYISTNKKPAIVKGTFATIKTALETP